MRPGSLKLTLLLVAALFCAALTWHVSAQEAPKQLPELADGQHALKGGESHSYRINLVTGQFFHALIEQQGIDVTVSLYKPDGSLISVSDSPNERFGPEPALLLADVSGEYRIEVRAPNPRASAANYLIKIVALREATATDKQHVAAQRAFDAAQKLRPQSDATAKRAAIAKYQESIPGFQAAGDTYRQTLAVHGTGIAYFQLNEPRNALPRFEEALALAQKVGDERIEAPIETYLGASFEPLGDIAKSHAHFERARVLSGRLGDKPTQGSAFTSIGKLLLEAGDFQRSLDYSLQALPLFPELPSRRAIALNNIGVAYTSLGEPERALDYLQQALEIMKGGTDRAAEAKTLNNIGYAYRRLAKYREAQDRFNQALAMAQKIGNRAVEADSLDHLGASYSDMDQPDKALDLHQRSLEIQRTTKNVRREMLSYGNLGHVYNLLGQTEKSLDHYNQALTISRSLGDLNAAANYLEGRAEVQQKLGNLAEARKDVEESLSLIETVRARSGSQTLKASYLASKEKAYELYVDVLMQLHAKDPSARHDAEALQASERGRARSLLEMLNEAPADIEQGVGVDLVKREREIRQAINAKAQRQIQLTAQNGSRQEIEAFGKEIGALEDEYQRVQVAIRKASPAYAALTQPQPLGLKEIQQLLEPNTVLLEYSLGDERSYVWAVTQDSMKAFALPKGEEIGKVAQQVYQSLTARSVMRSLETPAQRDQRIAQADAQFQQSSAELARMILAPAAAEFGTKRMVVIADGALQYVPFAALPLPGSNQRPLILDHELVSLPSASSLAIQRQTLANRKPAPKAVAVIADPVFSARDSRFKSASSTTSSAADDTRIIEHVGNGSGGPLNVRRLPFTRQEADRILAVSPAGSNLRAVDFRANRSIATSGELSNYRYVHFATHGYLDTSRAGLSAIVLSLVDEQGKPQDGFLRTHDIYNLKLPAELVVLSACETGLGKDVKGEGLEGLTRGFMYAGARRVVVSLWNVNDKATAGLMQHLYVGMLKNKKTPAAALRAAQIEMMKVKPWQSPYYWAAFVMQGEWR